MKHPCVIQLRNCELKTALRLAEKFGGSFEKVEGGADVYFEDVNDARKYLSKLRKLMRFRTKMSTSYAGLRRGRVRVLFVYSVRCDEDRP